MINVPDGYGDASAIEIPKNDSLYIFIEVKVDPILIKDSLIFQWLVAYNKTLSYWLMVRTF